MTSHQDIQQKSFKSIPADILTFLICAAGALICVYFFYRDINATLTRTGEQPIATITYRYNIAQRRFIDRLMWDRLKTNSLLYNGDVIRTVDLSEVKITFTHGDIVELFPNTLVQIFADSKGSVIDISGGGVSVASASETEIVVVSGEKRVVVESNSVLQAVTKDGEMNVALNEGNAFIENINSREEPVVLETSFEEIEYVRAPQVSSSAPEQNRGNNSITSSRTRSTATARAINLTAPAHNALVNIEKGGRDILFSWRRNTEAAFYTLRVSANREMLSPVIEQTTTNTNFRYSTEETLITPGTWFWSVQYTNASGAASPVSEPRAFTAIQGEVVQRSVFPPDNYTIANNFLEDTRFTWKSNLLDNRFQVAQNEIFSPLLIDEPASIESFTIRSLSPGNYFWRITGGAESQQMASPVRRFTITESLPPPQLSPPVSGVTAQTGNVSVRRNQPINFNWQPLQGAEYYVFRMYREGSPQVLVTENIVYENRFSINMNNYENGEYTWTVQALAGESATSSRRTGLTASQTINVRHLRPITTEHPRGGFAFPGFEASRRPGTARWSTPERAVNIEFILAKDLRITDVVHRERDVARNFTLPPLTEGDYYWVISGQTADGFDITSEPAHFKVLPVARLAVPQNRLPESRFTLDVQQLAISRSINFSWARVQGANAYQVTIFQGTGRTRKTVVQSQIINGTSYTVDDIRSLGRGTFYWQVEALSVLDNNLIEQRGNLAENILIIDIPAPGETRTVDTGNMYGL